MPPLGWKNPPGSLSYARQRITKRKPKPSTRTAGPHMLLGRRGFVNLDIDTAGSELEPEEPEDGAVVEADAESAEENVNNPDGPPSGYGCERARFRKQRTMTQLAAQKKILMVASLHCTTRTVTEKNTKCRASATLLLLGPSGLSTRAHAAVRHAHRQVGVWHFWEPTLPDYSRGSLLTTGTGTGTGTGTASASATRVPP